MNLIKESKKRLDVYGDLELIEMLSWHLLEAAAHESATDKEAFSKQALEMSYKLHCQLENLGYYEEQTN